MTRGKKAASDMPGGVSCVHINSVLAVQFVFDFGVGRIAR